MKQAILDDNGLTTQAGWITVYNYDGITGEFLSQSEEYLATGIGIPANSCLESPPVAKESFALCRADNQWCYLQDHRGESYYSTETGQPITISALGELPDNITELVPVTPHDRWDGEQWVTDIEAQQAAAIQQATAQKNRLLAEANDAIAPLQDAVDLEIATEQEIDLLKEWKTYRVLLNRIDVDTPDLIWPKIPA
ncbi:MAG: tail fiber assembly protein [Enterobacteriaceae bacterium]